MHISKAVSSTNDVGLHHSELASGEVKSGPTYVKQGIHQPLLSQKWGIMAVFKL